jgi:hypothetical protein
MTATYVYGLVSAGTELPPDLDGLGPSGQVSTITHERVAAIVSDVPTDRPLGTRDDLIAHERVLDTIAQRSSVLPMRFPAVVEEQGIVQELLAPHQARFIETLARMDGLVQYTLKGRYEQDPVLREITESDEEIRTLREQVRELPEDASYYDRIRLGELVVDAMKQRREADGTEVLERLQPLVVDVSIRALGAPDEVVNVAYLVERDRVKEFDDAVENIGRNLAGRVRFRLVGPLAPYDFVREN